MPVFTFEKLSPPLRRGQLPVAKKQRGVIAQMLGRFAEARVKRNLRAKKRVTERSQHRPAD